MERYIWLYPEIHEEHAAIHPSAHLHLTVAKLAHEDPALEQRAHAFAEEDVIVPRSDEHPTGRAVAHEIRAACGLTRSSWVNPVVATVGKPVCAMCKQKVGLE